MCPSVDEWIKKRGRVQTVEYNSAMKKKEILPFATTQLDLEGVRLIKYVSKRKANIVGSRLCGM